MIYREIPQDFHPRFDVVSCFIESDGEILLLHRQDHKPEGNTWGVPAGKVDKGEEISETMVREIQEETGFQLPQSQLSYFGEVYVRYPRYDFVYHIFHTRLNQRQRVTRNQKEHKDNRWISPGYALDMPLIQDLDACIRLFYGL